MLGGAVGIDDAEQPQAAAAELHGHTDGGPDHGEVEVGAEELQASDAEQVGDPFHVVAEVEVTQARDDGQGCGQGRTLSRSYICGLVRTRVGARVRRLLITA